MKTSLAFLSILILLLSCRKDEPPADPKCLDEYNLPCLTTEGYNNFACLIDGEPFVAELQNTGFGGSPAVSSLYEESTGLIRVEGTKEHDDESLENIYFKSYIGQDIGNKTMYSVSNSYVGYRIIGKSACEYYHDTLNYGSINIVYHDTIKGEVAGYFSMTLINESCSESTTMKITHGRFDISY